MDKLTLKTFNELIFFIFAVDMICILEDINEEEMARTHSLSEWNVGKSHVGARVQAGHVSEILIEHVW